MKQVFIDDNPDAGLRMQAHGEEFGIVIDRLSEPACFLGAGGGIRIPIEQAEPVALFPKNLGAVIPKADPSHAGSQTTEYPAANITRARHPSPVQSLRDGASLQLRSPDVTVLLRGPEIVETQKDFLQFMFRLNRIAEWILGRRVIRIPGTRTAPARVA